MISVLKGIEEKEKMENRKQESECIKKNQMEVPKRHNTILNKFNRR